MTLSLKALEHANKPAGPVILAIMDGVGIGPGDESDIVSQADTPHLDWLKTNALSSQLKAHGAAVGMPADDDMGNSEVGHNAIGSGRVFAQGAKLVNIAVEDGSVFEGETWREFVKQVKDKGTKLHFIGLLSDGNVHTHIRHLEAMLKRADVDGVQTARVHALLDGRDVDPTSADQYVTRIESLMSDLNAVGRDYAIGSGGGRLYITMDRYEADWPMVQRGWDCHVHGKGRAFPSAQEAIATLREEDPGVIDQDLREFVITRDGEPIGKIEDGDAVILFNFRGDRAMEISKAFDAGPDFDKIDRGRVPDVLFAGMMQYDADVKVPRKFLVSPPVIDSPMGEYIAGTGLRQLAISETQKYGHVTYFFNGNRTGKFNEALEEYVEIPGDNVSFSERPWMKSAEITDVVLASMAAKKHDFIRINYPNGDMVGHTGDVQAVKISVEATDLAIGRLMKMARKTGSILVVTADHGNADEMYEHSKDGSVKRNSEGVPKSKTAHTLNPVPVYIYDPAGNANVKLSGQKDLGISSLAATCIRLLGYAPPSDYDPSIVE
ncbi:MAG: 2,3-bisphosphoglycerate-independent phosphoglycerate mutase [Verrucomicrobia bacterium]|nr:2,3-bisphosphoglycerate-independent phosphoglycerate mutase [Verrucomicrobiota bacterium]MCH8514254.1 2,3-bisphosphoglycerate-independent phosphoglycerate mutase [Kiritimatiellia bacterium]